MYDPFSKDLIAQIWVENLVLVNKCNMVNIEWIIYGKIPISYFVIQIYTDIEICRQKKQHVYFHLHICIRCLKHGFLLML